MRWAPPSWSTMSSPRRSFRVRSQQGADVVIYSATKHIDGQGRALGGVILGSRDYHPQDGGALHEAHRRRDVALHRLDHAQGAGNHGPARARAGRDRAGHRGGAGRSRETGARDLSRPCPAIPSTRWRWRRWARAARCWRSSSTGGQAAAFRFLNALEIVMISNNLGDAKSIVTHPATTTHQRLPEDQKVALGITPGLVRLSRGARGHRRSGRRYPAGAGAGLSRVRGPARATRP